MTRVLIAEDEPRIAAFLEQGFRADGFLTAIASDGQTTCEMIASREFDLLILDLGLPKKDGWTVLEELRGQGEQLPIILLAASGSVQDIVAGLESGADDCVAKPFHFEELLARVRLRLRHARAAQNTEIVLQVGDVELDLQSHQLQVGDRQIELSAREFVLAQTFLRHPGRVLSHEHLLKHVWGYDYDPGSNIVNVYIGYLRKKMGNGYIQTVRGTGYRFQPQHMPMQNPKFYWLKELSSASVVGRH
ncbi:response regulator transcription factor [Thermoleptolyngbya sp. C42_A2020_037]|uniref:response regulator transcription factor n=1 Tax=Thermoleptolyngbya sp. C42_A2020_037 TaxID=2747799 RepID=UPI0019E641FC|nr:response regulator transcription factor [Thermoleptolyngbya sp. C42_A2020_037]MBF2086663.1 response regulator transcription factor [Thermoleptolyngbya sp. C42_A2020_037]